ncbi:Rha family transcriptional regulator [Brucella pseudintermedia]|uniref:Rha family transcriptional regulator n=1 Tax=Brucella pseudintermedia TaxID=370111 RepID=A0ABY5UBJ7_9HYPH|nr:Rha family transcriptional regulator [Brucella pseudintermedia]UWL60716.1 Rha family transcriptional regulator [Brucella pseudintermedia]
MPPPPRPNATVKSCRGISSFPVAVTIGRCGRGGGELDGRQTTTNPIVTIRNGKVFANSRDVADFFGKRHANVLRAIDDLECSPRFTQLNFEFSDYLDSTGRKLRSVNMTKDGFAFLVMGFTGKRALEFKLSAGI